ncbi:MAG: uracil-DNA glycosylase [Ghiorsea sp.]
MSVKNADEVSSKPIQVAQSETNPQNTDSVAAIEKADIAQPPVVYAAEVPSNIPTEPLEPPVPELAEPESPTYIQAEPALTEVESPPTKEITKAVVKEQQDEQQTQTTIPADTLSALQTQAEACKACDLASSRNQLVFGSGNQNADLVFIGDAPGRDEDLAGSPFVGASGKLFDRMLSSIALNRDDVYLMNGVKCMPEHSRDPKPIEFASCERWLVSQLDMIQPRLICLLGRVVAEVLLKNDLSLKALREGQFSFRGIPVLVIDHPSYLLRSQKHKRRAWEDLNRLKNHLNK